MRWMREARPGFRADVQALRAIAVLMVVLFHFFPSAVPGGYAGVDVFFVISGYLITTHLVKSQTGSGIRLAEFWARRARRLLPAALLVILVTAIGVAAFAPHSRWPDSAEQAIGATLYVVNWVLAANAVDYLASTNDATAFQHYWSLSVEEQFYIVWPLLLLLAALLIRRAKGRLRLATWIVLGVVTAASLAYSIELTATDPAAAYFVTPTRGWEFGVGGLLSLLPAVRVRWVRAGLGWVGVAAILGTAFGYDSDTPFPGAAALLPVLGTAAAIHGGIGARWGFDRIARFMPLQFVGDVSYSLYLWHWPIIVLVPYLLDGPMPWWLALVGLAASIVLAWLSKRFVEDPIRTTKRLTAARPRRSLLGALAAMLVVAILPASLYADFRLDRHATNEAFGRLVASGAECLGAGALAHPDCDDTALGGRLFPVASDLLADTGDAYDCYTNAAYVRIKSCTYGSTRPDALKVALSGDSHAAMLLVALKPALEALNWRLTTYIGRGPCTTFQARPASDRCADIESWLESQLAGHAYDVVLVSAKRSAGTSDAAPGAVLDPAVAAQAQARAAAWGPVLDAGTKVVAIGDDPGIPPSLWQACTRYRDLDLSPSAACIPSEAAVTPPDSVLAAAALDPRARTVDQTDLFCDEGACPLVIGHVIVYRDGNHPTASYEQTVAPYLLARIRAAIG